VGLVWGWIRSWRRRVGVRTTYSPASGFGGATTTWWARAEVQSRDRQDRVTIGTVRKSLGALAIAVIAGVIANLASPPVRSSTARAWHAALRGIGVEENEVGPGRSTNPLGFDSTVDTKHLTEGPYYYCHGVCDIPLRSLPALSAPALAATAQWPAAHAQSGHTYHSICQATGERVQDDRPVASTIWAFVEVEGGYRGWVSEVWFGFRGIVTKCSPSDLHAPQQ
jgi:hypothetical protein